jgi:hypothetical protein
LTWPIHAVTSRHDPEGMALDRTLAPPPAPRRGANRCGFHRFSRRSSQGVDRGVPRRERRAGPGEPAADRPRNLVSHERRAPQPATSDPATERATVEGSTPPLARHGPSRLLLAHVAPRHDLPRTDPMHGLPACSEPLVRRREPCLGHGSEGDRPPCSAGVDAQPQPPEGDSQALLSRRGGRGGTGRPRSAPCRWGHVHRRPRREALICEAAPRAVRSCSPATGPRRPRKRSGRPAGNFEREATRSC